MPYARLKEIALRFKGRKWIVRAVLGAFAAVLILAGYFLSGSGKVADSPTLKILPENVDIQVKDVHFTEVGDSDSTWDIRADSARYMKKENKAVFEKVKITLIRKDGRTFTMSGDTGRMDTETKDAEIWGNVVLTSDRGDRISTEKVFYSGKEKKAYTDGEITLVRPGLDLKGKGMVFLVDEKHVTLFSAVRAVVKKE